MKLRKNKASTHIDYSTIPGTYEYNLLSIAPIKVKINNNNKVLNRTNINTKEKERLDRENTKLVNQLYSITGSYDFSY